MWAHGGGRSAAVWVLLGTAWPPVPWTAGAFWKGFSAGSVRRSGSLLSFGLGFCKSLWEETWRADQWACSQQCYWCLRPKELGKMSKVLMTAESRVLITASASDLCLWLFSFSHYLVIWVISCILELKQQKLMFMLKRQKILNFLTGLVLQWCKMSLKCEKLNIGCFL